MAKGIQKAEYNDPTPNNFPDDYDRNDVDSRVLIRTNAVLNKEFGGQTRAAMAQAEEITSVVAGEAKSEASHATQTANDLQQRYQDQIEGQIDPSEVVDARRPVGANAYQTLNQRLQAGVDDRSMNVKAFGVKGDGTTDDLAAINTLIANANDGDTLFFPMGNYKTSGNIVINKKLNIVGVKPTYSDGDLVRGTVIRGGGIFFVTGSSNSSVSSIGVVVATGFTNGFDIRGTLMGITIQDCLTIAQSHGYLIESYDGLVEDTVIERCEAHDSIHGFISKATRTTFDSCLAKDIGFWGFGVISDNIQGANKIGAAINNKVVNCRAVKAGVAFSQYRRNYFDDNPDIVPCDNNQFLGCSNTDCTYGLSVGDKVGDTGSGKYTTYPVTNTVVTNYSEGGGKVCSFNSKNLVINGITLQTPTLEITEDATHTNLGMTASGISGEDLGRYNNINILDNTTTPSLGFGRVFRTNNKDYTEITNFSDVIPGATYTIIMWENYTTIKPSDQIMLFDRLPVNGYGASVTLRAQSGLLFEVNRSNVIDAGTQKNVLLSGFDIGTHRFIDVVQKPTDNPKPIHINNPESHDADLTILLRPTTGSIIPAGFDSAQFVVPNDFPDSLTFGNGLMTHWKYLIAIRKYVLVNWRLTKYV